MKEAELLHFSQFVREDGRRWPATRFKKFGKLNMNGSNCWACGAALGIIYALGGKFEHTRRPNGFQCTGKERPTPPRVRFWSRDHIGGGGIDEIERAAKHWGVKPGQVPREQMQLDYRAPIPRIERRVGNGMLALMQTEYAQIEDRFSCEATFDKGHHLVLRRIGQHDFGGDLGVIKGGFVSDSLCRKPRWIPWGQIVKALEGYSEREGFGTVVFVRPVQPKPKTDGPIVVSGNEEGAVSTIDYVRDRFCELAPGTPMHDVPDGTVIETVGSSAPRIPLLSFTEDGKWAQVGISTVAGEEVKRPLFVKKGAVSNIRIDSSPDAATMRSEIEAELAQQHGKEIEQARRKERESLEDKVKARVADIQTDNDELEKRIDSLRQRIQGTPMEAELTPLLADDEDDD